MGRTPSAAEVVRAWVEGHVLVDGMLFVAAEALLLLIVLSAIAGALYWVLWLVRLSKRANIAKFTAQEIPGLHKGKAAGLEIEFGSVARAETETLRVMGLTVEELSFRLGSVEATAKKLEEAVERFEDVSGRA